MRYRTALQPLTGGKTTARGARRRHGVATPAPAGWQNSAVVGLDDDDIGFADIEEYQPRRVVNA